MEKNTNRIWKKIQTENGKNTKRIIINNYYVKGNFKNASY